MRKVLLVAAMLLISVVGFCQTPHKVYCELVGTQKFLSPKVSVSIDLGLTYGDYNNKIVDNKGKSITFNTMVDALNYLSKRGWEFCQAYAYSTGGSQNVIHYLLSKTVIEDKQIFDGLKIKGMENSQDQEIKETKQIERDPATYKDLDPKSSEYWELKEKYEAKKKAEKKSKFDEIYK